MKRHAPQIAIIQIGENNRYGHPTQDCLNRLEADNIEIHRNDLEGDFEIMVEKLSDEN